MNKKYKMTAFARLLIFAVIFTPIAYIGVSYYEGEDGLEKIKRLFDQEVTVEDQISAKKARIHELEYELKQLRTEVSSLEAKASQRE